MHGGILVGVDTVIADDPDLTVRLPGYVGVQPARIVLDSRQRIPMTCRLVATADRIRTIVISTEASNACLTDAGVEVVTVSAEGGRVSAKAAVEAIGNMTDFSTILIEGGGQVAASFIGAGLVDALEWFRAPILLGAEGRPAIAALGLQQLSAAPRFERVTIETLGDDLWERYVRT
jgi:diaminohydroxyphosphoribosylaminopyrimidine deaminase/5-amino-6-(5-phosphoribosylamino)uracil reductase